MAVERAHTLILKFGADSREDMVRALRHLAMQMEKDEISVGLTGGYSWGGMWSYKTDPAMTHDAYFQQLNAELEAADAAKAAQV